MIHTTARKTTGFTLTELVVVIGIMALLMAIIIPATQSLRRGNRIATSAFKLQQISNAMKAYHFDYGSVPPGYPGYPGPFNAAAPVDGPGLVALWKTGYLGNRRALHCPSDTKSNRQALGYCPSAPAECEKYTDPNDAAYYLSYADRDLDAITPRDFDNYKYLSTRGIFYTDPPDAYFKRQLEDPLFYETDPALRRNWYPDDETVVTWCNFHTKEYFRDGEPQYQVLFWDGSTKTLPAKMFDHNESGAIPVWQADPD